MTAEIPTGRPLSGREFASLLDPAAKPYIPETDDPSSLLHCPAGNCSHTEEYDHTDETDSPEDPASSDIAYDAIVAHLGAVHGVPEGERGRLASQARRTVVREVNA